VSLDHQTAATTTPDAADLDGPRTALLSQSNRTWQTEAALEQTRVSYEIDPADPWATVRYNRLKEAVSDADGIDLDTATPTKPEAVAALERAGYTPDDLRE